MKDQFSKGDYKYCVDCWRTPDRTEFFIEGKQHPWQDTVRCKECHKIFINKFLKKYPDFKSRIKYKKLKDKDIQKYIDMLELERFFEEVSNNV